MATNKKITLTLDTFFKVQCSQFFTALGCKVETEVELLKQPRRLDVLVIQENEAKAKRLIHEKFHILGYFQKYNLVSYKSFRDNFAISDIHDAIIYYHSYLNLKKQAEQNNTTMTLIVSQRPTKFLNQVKARVSESVKGRYCVDYHLFQIYIVNIEEALPNDSLDGIFLSEFVKNKNKITVPSDVRKGIIREKKIVDILEEGLKTRLVTFEGVELDMGAVADITKYVLPELEKAETKGKIEGKIEDARIMLEDGVPLEKVIKYTGLTKAQLKEAGLIK